MLLSLRKLKQTLVYILIFIIGNLGALEVSEGACYKFSLSLYNTTALESLWEHRKNIQSGVIVH